MFYPTTTVQMLDLDHKPVAESKTLTLDDLWRRYIEHNDHGTIWFGGLLGRPSVRLKEIFGWTELVSMTKLDYDISHPWVGFLVSDPECNVYSTNIICDKDQPIPCWIDDHPEYGFHGEIKYAYYGVPADEVKEEHKLRCVRFNPNRFCNPTIIHPYGTEDDHGYELITKSGFCNMNNILMYATKDVSQIMRLN